MFRTFTPAIYLISLGAFALGMASYSTAGLLPMIGATFSIPIAIAAQVVTAFTLAYAIGSPICVTLIPAHMHRTGILAAMAVFVISNIASALSNSFTLLLFFRAISGVGAGVYLAMGISASVLISNSEKRGKEISLIMGGMASGTVLGVPVCLLVANYTDWTSALWIIALLGLISLTGLYLKLPDLPPTKTIPLRSRLSLLLDKRVVTILTVSLLAAIASLGMYTFVAPLVKGTGYSVTPYLWIWGIGGVLGSFFIGALMGIIKNTVLTMGIMIILSAALFSIPLSLSLGPWFIMLPIAIWGAVGWALQVPQNSELIAVREKYGDGNLAVALNESSLYLGSAIGTISGGLMLLQHWPVRILALCAGIVAIIGALFNLLNFRK
ncbi:TPA: MFS transporter [Salmonella enterica]